MTKPLQQAYAHYTLGKMIIEELQQAFDGHIPSDNQSAQEIEEQGEAYREEAAWLAATNDSSDCNDLVLKARILRSYAEDDHDDVISCLVNSICADIGRLIGDEANRRPETAVPRKVLQMHSSGPLASHGKIS